MPFIWADLRLTYLNFTLTYALFPLAYLNFTHTYLGLRAYTQAILLADA